MRFSKRKSFWLSSALILLIGTAVFAQSRNFSGSVVTAQFEFVPGATITIETSSGTQTVVSDSEGRFSIAVPDESISVTVSGKNIETQTRMFARDEKIDGVQIKIKYVVPPISESVVIEAESLTPEVENRNDSIYKNNLFGRDDQLVFTLNAGINAGQHEGGGKSLEIRRFGFNLDHGGVNGGLKVLVDNVQQNQGTQGHGQGYLGALKSLSPELVGDVSIINGPFSAAYGDFSGLGVVQIRQKESLPDVFTLRIQGGSFGTFRTFAAISPKINNVDSFLAYEFSRTDGPFKNPLKYRRDNVTANFTRRFGERTAAGIKFNFGRNDFYSSGQIPLDLVASGDLDRFDALDPENGGRVRLGTIGGYFRKEFESGATFKADAFVGRSMFDLFSNFTFFLADPVYGDEIQQHDSRLQEGANVQFLQPYKFFGNQALVTVGANLHLSQINVGLYPTIGRDPSRKFLPGNIDNPDVLLTSAHANVNNYAGYVQNELEFYNGHLRIETGLRFDYFGFKVDGFDLSGTSSDLGAGDCFADPRSCGDPLVGKEGAGKLQPKLGIAWTPFEKTPLTFYFNYGRGISSQDARGVVRDPNSPKVSTTDFYQSGVSLNSRRFSVVATAFLIDRSNEQVYIPDDGSTEFAGRSRSYGFELRNSIRLTKFLAFNGGVTQVVRAFYPGQFAGDGTRLIVDSAPHTVANAGLVLSGWRGFNSSLSWRSISGYRLDGEDRSIRAAGNDVVDFALTKRLKNWIDLNFSVDNLLNKHYFETQNYFESRTCPTCDVISRIHATPGYSTTVSFGVTLRFGKKD